MLRRLRGSRRAKLFEHPVVLFDLRHRRLTVVEVTWALYLPRLDLAVTDALANQAVVTHRPYSFGRISRTRGAQCQHCDRRERLWRLGHC